MSFDAKHNYPLVRVQRMSNQQLYKETFFKEECNISKQVKSGSNLKIVEARQFFKEGKALLEKGEYFEALENFNSVSA